MSADDESGGFAFTKGEKVTVHLISGREFYGTVVFASPYAITLHQRVKESEYHMAYEQDVSILANQIAAVTRAKP